jgi:phytoene dehydrogenase-like protein
MAMAMAKRCEELGVQIEYRQEVEKILVKNGHVYGVRTKRGDEIHADYVSCSSYPNTCYAKMIEPQSEVPAAIRS